MALAASSLDKSAATIRDMFAGVAPRYDLLNRLLSGRLDTIWRRRAARRLDGADGPVLDLCAGTGDQALALAARAPERRVTATDFCLPMLALARRKAAGKQVASLNADALALPFPDARFAAVTVSFGVRNLADLDAGLREIRRVLAKGGRLVILEFALPEQSAIRRPYLWYFRRVLPRLGALLSPRGSAYGYLPSSVLTFPQRVEFTERLRAAGFGAPSSTDLTLGTVCLYEAVAE
jgi:demethylmenaquinone methyltransferase/2-methoxy-6-polyprenyl-1,4-benzoquinol methylase